MIYGLLFTILVSLMGIVALFALYVFFYMLGMMIGWDRIFTLVGVEEGE